MNKLKKKNSFLTWKIDKKILNTEDYKLNNKVAKKYSKKNFNVIVNKYTNILPKNVDSLLKVDKKVWISLKKSGADLGGGVGVVASLIAKKKIIDKIYCVEPVENAVKKCQPIIKNKILKKNKNKVISVLGTFDNIELNNSSLDFCIALDAMHHSSNLIKTLKEVKKVLKKNGKFIVIDRAHNNNTTDKEIKKKENIVYGKEFLKANFFPLNKILTRKMNGEREYRFKEWEGFFKKVGFKIEHSIIIKENHKKALKVVNDMNIKEKIVKFKIGGFDKKKIIYVLGKN